MSCFQEIGSLLCVSCCSSSQDSKNHNLLLCWSTGREDSFCREKVFKKVGAIRQTLSKHWADIGLFVRKKTSMLTAEKYLKKLVLCAEKVWIEFSFEPESGSFFELSCGSSFEVGCKSSLNLTVDLALTNVNIQLLCPCEVIHLHEVRAFS